MKEIVCIALFFQSLAIILTGLHEWTTNPDDFDFQDILAITFLGGPQAGAVYYILTKGI